MGSIKLFGFLNPKSSMTLEKRVIMTHIKAFQSICCIGFSFRLLNIKISTILLLNLYRVIIHTHTHKRERDRQIHIFRE